MLNLETVLTRTPGSGSRKAWVGREVARGRTQRSPLFKGRRRLMPAALQAKQDLLIGGRKEREGGGGGEEEAGFEKRKEEQYRRALAHQRREASSPAMMGPR